MALSRPAWIAVGLVARVLMVAVLVVSVHLMYTNHVNRIYDSSAYYDLKSYKYAVAAAIVGAAGGVAQIPIAVYLLFKSKRMTPSSLILGTSMYTDMVVSVVLATSVGAGFGASTDTLQIVDAGDWTYKDTVTKDLGLYFGKAVVATVFLLIGMLLPMCATVVSVRLWANKAGNDDLGVV
ncbi:hypothetical protein ACP4OV_005920 [Aristida adscensionis]